jgi:hypothetical protein
VSSQDILDILREEVVELREMTPEGVKGGNKLDVNAYECGTEKAKGVLGISVRSKQETFVDLAKQLLELERVE